MSEHKTYVIAEEMSKLLSAAIEKNAEEDHQRDKLNFVSLIAETQYKLREFELQRWQLERFMSELPDRQGLDRVVLLSELAEDICDRLEVELMNLKNEVNNAESA